MRTPTHKAHHKSSNVTVVTIGAATVSIWSHGSAHLGVRDLKITIENVNYFDSIEVVQRRKGKEKDETV